MTKLDAAVTYFVVLAIIGHVIGCFAISGYTARRRQFHAEDMKGESNES